MDRKQKITFVDGFKIRNTLDVNFNIIHKYSSKINEYTPKFYIPKKEIWFDHIFKKELDFLLKIENAQIPQEIKSWSEAREYIRKNFCLPGPIPEFILKKEKHNDLTIAYVDGSIVRQYIDPEFIFGGHDLVYSYIPEKEVWVDGIMDKRELPYVLFHEESERKLMTTGKNYDVAHEYASAAEREMRRLEGVGFYPGDANYHFRNLKTKKIIKKHYVIRKIKKNQKN